MTFTDLIVVLTSLIVLFGVMYMSYISWGSIIKIDWNYQSHICRNMLIFEYCEILFLFFIQSQESDLPSGVVLAQCYCIMH